MISTNGEGPAAELDALFPGLSRGPAPRPSLVQNGVPLPAPLILGDLVASSRDRPLASARLAAVPEADRLVAKLYGAYWADPRRMLWTPFLAGAAVRLSEIFPQLFSADLLPSATMLATTASATEPMWNIERMAIAELALAVVPLLRECWAEDRALAELGLDPEMSLADRVQAVKHRLPESPKAAAWMAVQLPATLLVGGGSVDRLLLASGPYRELGAGFAALAGRQGIERWEDAVVNAIEYWRDLRGSGSLEAMFRYTATRSELDDRAARPRAEGKSLEAIHPRLRKLEARLAQAKREAEAARTESGSCLARAATAQREAAEARRGRDRAAERLRRVERENAELREALRLLHPAPSGQELEAVRSEALPPTPLAQAEPPRPSLAAVFAGRLVYLYTGIERVAAREAMARALERHGASCEVFDGNSLGQLGPNRFPAESLVIIETSHLCHNGSNMIQARARASGAWVYVGATGSGALARRVAERWWKTHRGDGRRASAVALGGAAGGLTRSCGERTGRGAASR